MSVRSHGRGTSESDNGLLSALYVLSCLACTVFPCACVSPRVLIPYGISVTSGVKA